LSSRQRHRAVKLPTAAAVVLATAASVAELATVASAAELTTAA
jgi:hypothetical protein